jgi:hypothetical protein
VKDEYEQYLGECLSTLFLGRGMHAIQNGERYQSLVGVCFSLFKTDFNSGCPISLFKTDFNFGCPNEAVVGDTLNGPLRLVATVVPLYPF